MTDPFEAPETKAMMKRLKERAREHEIRSRKTAQNLYLRKCAIEIGTLAPGVEYWIVNNPLDAEIDRMREEEKAGKRIPGFVLGESYLVENYGALNGYVSWPKKRAPLKARKMSNGILDYIPVHGGITYALKDRATMTYGFDTLHCNSADFPRTDRAWIRLQCKALYDAVVIASKIERAYNRATTNDERVRILKPLGDLVPDHEMPPMTMMGILARGSL